MMDTKFEVTNKIYREMFANYLTYQWGWNYERQWVDGCLFTLTSVLKRIYENAPIEAEECTIKRHLEFLSTYATLVPSLFDLITVLEAGTPEDEEDSITSIETRLMGPTAGLGDGLFWFTLQPVCASIGTAIAVTDNILGVIFIFTVFNILDRGMRWFGFHIGYTEGMETTNSGSGDEITKRTSGAATVLSLCVAGRLVFAAVKVNVLLVFTSDEGKVVVQELINKIVPYFPPVLIIAFCY